MDLDYFSLMNLKRCTQGFNHQLQDWSVAEWTNAVAGEAGEACNLAKKLLRHRDSQVGNTKAEDKDESSLRLRCARELADSIVYADLTIQRLGFKTQDVLRDTFNAKSVELGSPIILTEDPST